MHNLENKINDWVIYILLECDLFEINYQERMYTALLPKNNKALYDNLQWK
jgi:hypothetical protein